MAISARSRTLLWGLFLIYLSFPLMRTIVFEQGEKEKFQMGGTIHAARHAKVDAQTVSAIAIDGSTRFERPSARPSLVNPYTFPDFENKITTPFSQSREVVLAYWGILKDASNMLGFSGGCGTIGYAEQPYPYAYELLTPEAQKRMPLNDFVDSFSGYGRILLLQLYPVSTPSDTPPDTAYYIVETESVTGHPEITDLDLWEPGGSLFAYHYGLITVKKQPIEGWKIDQLDFIPEGFLCAPFHGWAYDAVSVVDIACGNNLGIVKKIEKVEIEDAQVTVFASGPGGRFRFDFLRLTNGCDILLRQYIFRDGAWTEENLLPPNWAYLQFGPAHF